MTLNPFEKVRQLKPYRYEYIDKLKSGTETVTGFKAQEVNSVISHSVVLGKDYIPNIYKECSIISNNIIEITSIR